MRSLARRGLDALLDRYPDADPADIYSQDETVVAAYNRMPRTPRDNGPWTVADLVRNGTLLRFAIWNATGNVYRVDQHGAAEEDPFITITGGT